MLLLRIIRVKSIVLDERQSQYLTSYLFKGLTDTRKPQANTEGNIYHNCQREMAETIQISHNSKAK